MRVPVLAIVCAVALSGTAVEASTIVQNVSGTQRGGTPLALFDPALGTLDSVQVEGTMGWSVDLVRLGAGTPLPAVDVPYTTSGSLILLSGSPFAPTTLTGSEIYAEGSMFGSIAVSGSVFALLTGAEVDRFIIAGQPTTLIAPFGGVPVPTVGQIVFNPGSPLGSYSLAVTYNYNAIPEPSTWAMMLFGFAAIGLARRYSLRPQLLPE
jgi:PEP-CTERM motif